MNHKQGIQAFARALRVLVESANRDGGKSYDQLAERIKARQADGLIQEAIGYVPEGLEMQPEGDPFKPIQHWGREGKQVSRMQGLPAPLVDKQIIPKK